jgi:hypothetical protein
MANMPPHPDSNGDPGRATGPVPGSESPPGTPRWVYMFGIVALLLVLLFVVLHLTGGAPGGH